MDVIRSRKKKEGRYFFLLYFKMWNALQVFSVTRAKNIKRTLYLSGAVKACEIWREVRSELLGVGGLVGSRICPGKLMEKSVRRSRRKLCLYLGFAALLGEPFI